MADGHLDRCHLPAERKRSEWIELEALRVGAAR
jgi:hypothetical protein